MRVTIESPDIERFRKAFAELPIRIQRRTIPRAIQEGADVLLLHTKMYTPVKSGFLLRHIGVGKGKRRKGRYEYYVGFPTPLYTGETFYAGFVEYGHAIGRRPRGLGRTRKAGGLYLADTRARVPEHPFLRPAFESARPGMEEAILTEMKAGIERAWARQGHA